MVRESLKKRGSVFDLEKLIGIDEQRRELIRHVEAMKNQRNVTSDEIARLKKSGVEAQETDRTAPGRRERDRSSGAGA